MNIFKQFYKSIYSPRDIASFRMQGKGKTILYLILLTLLASIPALYYLSSGINEGVKSLSNTLEEDSLSFSIKDNELKSNAKEPTIINKDDLTIIIDSTGTYEESNISASGNTVALLQKEFIIVAAGQSQTFEYSSFGNVSITKDDIAASLNAFDSMLPILITILAVVYFIILLISKVIEAFVFAVFGSLFARTMRRTLTYGQLWRITVYSMTLPTLFFVIMDAIQTSVPNGMLLNWVVTLFMLFLSIKEVPFKKQPEENIQ
ncbi:DUF1189 domain-containing protein [Niallia sp. NCCP-28]|uniref:DUF1189 domain-containing protein n=1 Tax=Niallia sp. NCCP-28 TaxID=2934712 RepID=UPI00207F7729|nr:DUF1189 domain-containing protein [Niallia sp. NCCP-28]GKU81277.1 hypothetical protein NCCP28_06730 [Niallia sp. NCCP-28]